jgi:hypothetical protein
MRHANSNITMNIYTHAVSSKKRRAQIEDAQDAILSMLRKTYSATGPHRIGDSRERKTPGAPHEECTRLKKATAAIELFGYSKDLDRKRAST